MSDLRTGLLLLSNMSTHLMWTPSRNRTRPNRPPLVGRLHEIAVAHPVPVPEVWRHLNVPGGGPVRSPQIARLGRLGSGNATLTKRFVAKNALRRWPVVVIDPFDGYEVLLDELAGCEPLPVLKGADRVIDPLTLEHARSNSPRVPAGEW